MNDDILNHLPKAFRIKEEIKANIRAGKMGEADAPFMSVRKLTGFAGVSLVTAQRIMTMLKEDSAIALENGRHIISPYNVAVRKNSHGRDGDVDDRLIGLVVPNIENPFFSVLAAEMESLVSEASMHLMIASSNYDLDKEKQVLEMFSDAGVRGIIASPGIKDGVSKLYSDLDVPFVFVTNKPKGIEADSVETENFNAAKMVSEHFVSRSYSNFGYFGVRGVKNDQRILGFRYGLEAMGETLAPERVILSEDMSYVNVADELLEYLKEIPKPAAIFCFHDLLALLLVKACSQLGLSIPEDIAIAGFDNLPLTSRTTPSLTTVGYPIRSMARIALNRLIQKSTPGFNSSATEYLNCTVEPKLFIRQSSSRSEFTEKTSDDGYILESIAY